MSPPLRLSTPLLIALLAASLAVNLWQFYRAHHTAKPAIPAISQPISNTPPQELPLEQSALVWLQQENFPLAIATLDRLHQESEEQAAELELAWAQELQARLDNHDYDFVDRALSALLDAYPYNEDFLLTEAQLLQRRGARRDAANAYYELAAQTQGSSADELITTARYLALQQLQQWQEGSQYPEALAFLDELLWREPSYAPYQIAMINALIGQGDFDQAELRLAELEGDPTLSHEASSLRQALSRARSPARTQLLLEADGNHLRVPVTFADGSRRLLLLDTGATLSVLSHSQLASLDDKTFLRQATLNTAAGPTQADIYRLTSVQLGPYQLAEVEFAVLPDEQLPADGLLGMNVLNRFLFHIDPEQKLLELQPRSQASQP
ncbi:retroviral-like aspartic protease family protein [Halioxenophilus sp. WMMB6]|uniref:retroviral-like aspartic protease family protein n=1 Tax=Halioxenophilus sp. WMMB6 TaxID=3073815 RepID=UPI00295E5AA7|nr:retroviral-like aspartic protease family protein [Halioxenophilus sp. WMMB6]